MAINKSLIIESIGVWIRPRNISIIPIENRWYNNGNNRWSKSCDINKNVWCYRNFYWSYISKLGKIIYDGEDLKLKKEI